MNVSDRWDADPNDLNVPKVLNYTCKKWYNPRKYFCWLCELL